MKSIKSQAEIRVKPKGLQVSEGLVDITLTVQNYFQRHAKLIDFEYSLDGGTTWNNCLDTTDEFDTEDLPATLRAQQFTFVWEAIEDIWQTQTYTDVLVRLRFEDPSGARTDYIEITIDELDFTPEYITRFSNPKPVDPYWDVTFQIYPVFTDSLYHFVLEVAETSSFDNILLSRDSEANQNGWNFDADGLLVETSPQTVEYNEPGGFDELSTGEYYIRVRPKVMDRYELADVNGNELYDRDNIQLMVL